MQRTANKISCLLSRLASFPGSPGEPGNEANLDLSGLLLAKYFGPWYKGAFQKRGSDIYHVEAIQTELEYRDDVI